MFFAAFETFAQSHSLLCSFAQTSKSAKNTCQIAQLILLPLLSQEIQSNFIFYLSLLWGQITLLQMTC